MYNFEGSASKESGIAGLSSELLPAIRVQLHWGRNRTSLAPPTSGSDNTGIDSRVAADNKVCVLYGVKTGYWHDMKR